MAITKDQILTEVNENLKEDFTDSQIDTAIQMCLDDMSEEDLLVGSATPTVNANDTTIPHPTGFRAMISLTLTDASGVSRDPLIRIPHDDYRFLKSEDAATGIPQEYSDFNQFFFLWRPANGIFTATIEFYKDHPQDVASIEFDETKFKNTVFAGSTYYVTLKHKKISYMNIWRPIYEDAKRKRSQSLSRNARIVS